MQPPIAPLTPPSSRSADERKLSRLFRALDGQSRQTLLDFAEFLAARSGDIETTTETPTELTSQDLGIPKPSILEQSVREPRPAQESVIAAIKRLRRTYPMLDASSLLNHTSSLMAAHVLKGRAAKAVIDDLEALFAAHFDKYRGNLQ
ncbi:MAG TPA: hypothetical protein DDY14_09340 [Chromatiaceae bacterium]|nr:MAG: hypothetical protein N838_04880 [Thiohalocapsa sp. PB-PSB1]HBG95507.1 hypothetical protein [Chromatiaceae bacterium]HCS91406.1 hypothetical protein [Chromatiaceae bacterium]